MPVSWEQHPCYVYIILYTYENHSKVMKTIILSLYCDYTLQKEYILINDSLLSFNQYKNPKTRKTLNLGP